MIGTILLIGYLCLNISSTLAHFHTERWSGTRVLCQVLGYIAKMGVVITVIQLGTITALNATVNFK